MQHVLQRALQQRSQRLSQQLNQLPPQRSSRPQPSPTHAMRAETIGLARIGF